MNTIYSFSFEIKTSNGQLLRAGQIFSRTLSEFCINVHNFTWALCGHDKEGLVYPRQAKYEKVQDNAQNKKQSPQYQIKYGEYILKYWYIKTRG
jgi:hypothetical protein